MKYGWNQPICESCWFDREPNRAPARMIGSVAENCAFCGERTTAGIFVRQDPATVRFPSLEDD